MMILNFYIPSEMASKSHMLLCYKMEICCS